jgi:gas vesicle protein
VTWQVAAALGGGAVGLVVALSFAWWAMATLRDAHGAKDKARDAHDVERRLRTTAEKERDAALANVVELTKTVVTLRAIKKVTEEQDATEAAEKAKEEQDAIAGSADAAADAAVDLMRR